MRLRPEGRRVVHGQAPALGIFVLEVTTPGLWPILEAASLDFGIIDLEHGAFSYRDVRVLLAGARSTGTVAFVRVPELSRSAIGKVLDLGADGVVVPRVESADQAAAIVAVAKYGPVGARNASFGLAHDGYRRDDLAANAAAANDGVACIALVETVAGVEAIEEIVAVAGIDAVLIGPTDLTHSLGCLGDTTNPAYVEAEGRILEACRREGMSAGLVVRSAERGVAAVERGFSMIALGSDISLIRSAAGDLATAVRDGVARIGRE